MSSRALVDSLGRTIDYLRLSITDRCNLRCLYCMPIEGVSWVPHDKVLRFEEILMVCRILAGMGISAVKVTGGEPLVRRGAVDLIREIRGIEGLNRVSMTSNGVLLGEYLEALVAVGLDAVNISLDTLNDEKFRWLTKSDGLAKVLSAIDKALELGFAVKVNCVPMRGFNEDDIAQLSALAKNRNIAVRFIELMPLGVATALQPLPAAEVVSLIEREHGPMVPSAAKLGNGPAAYYTMQGFVGHIGLISAISECFCASCNRLRLTASGILKPCLSSDIGLDLAGMVRCGASSDEIEGAIRELVSKKPARHSFGGFDTKLVSAIKTADTTPVHDKKEVCAINMFRIGG